MSTGDTVWTPGGRNVTRFENNVPLANEYDLKPRFSKWEVRCKEGPGNIPYVSGPIEVMGTAKTEGGKNAIIFHSFFLNLEAGADGVAGTDRGGGFTEFCKCTGSNPTLAPVPKQRAAKHDEAGNVVKPAAMVMTLPAQAVLNFLKTLDGITLRGRTKRKKTDDGYRAEVDYFIEPEGGLDSGPVES